MSRFQVGKPEVLQVSVLFFILQQLTPDEIVTQAKLRHGQYLGFVSEGVARRSHQLIPVLTTGKSLTELVGRNSSEHV